MERVFPNYNKVMLRSYNTGNQTMLYLAYRQVRAYEACSTVAHIIIVLSSMENTWQTCET